MAYLPVPHIFQDVTTTIPLSELDTDLAYINAKVISVADFGAVGDGVADDTAAIQAAITYCISSEYRELIVPEGIYKVTSTLSIPNGPLRMRGAGGKWASVIYRTGDYGDTVTLGASGVGGVYDIQMVDLKFQYDLGATYDGSGFITAIARKPTLFPNSAHIRAYGPINCHFIRCRLNDMPYQMVVNGGAYSYWDAVETQGLWDSATAGLQVTHANIQLNKTATQGHPQGMQFHRCQWLGNLSAARNVTYNATVVNMNVEIGPKYMLEVNSSEVLHIRDGLMGGANTASLYIHPSVDGVSQVTVEGVHFDGDRLQQIIIGNEASLTGYTANVSIVGCDFVGSHPLNSILVVDNSGVGLKPVYGLNIVGNMFDFCASTPISIQDGGGVMVSSNSLRAYNYYGAWTTPADSSAIAFIGSATKFYASGNIMGGGNAWEAYDGVANNCEFGIYISNPAAMTYQIGRNTVISINPTNNVDRAETFGPQFLVRSRTDEDQNLLIQGQVSVTGAMSIAGVNKANNANIPLEYRATKHHFVGPLEPVTTNTEGLGTASKMWLRVASTDYLFRSAADDPVAADLPATGFIVWKNTNLNEVRVWVNDAGTLKKSAAFT